MDAHDEAAKAMFEWALDRRVVNINVEASLTAIAAALRKAAADGAAEEREACAAYVREQSAKVPRDHSTLSDAVREVLRITADALDAGHRARAKGGA